jgi:pyruvate dehydrogenase E1 component beta subunit
VHREGEDVTVVATGRLVHEALAAAEEAEQSGVSVEVVDLRCLIPLDARAVLDGGMPDWAQRGGRTIEFRRCGS